MISFETLLTTFEAILVFETAGVTKRYDYFGGTFDHF